jgi:hypothetical protein
MRILKYIALFLFIVSGVTAQDLSKLTPEQIEIYKKYMSGGSLNTGNSGMLMKCVRPLQ